MPYDVILVDYSSDAMRGSPAREFLTLNGHIERVLWQFGVFPWRTDQGEVRSRNPSWH